MVNGMEYEAAYEDEVEFDLDSLIARKNNRRKS
jgi:hypothetical protein